MIRRVNSFVNDFNDSKGDSKKEQLLNYSVINVYDFNVNNNFNPVNFTFAKEFNIRMECEC